MSDPMSAIRDILGMPTPTIPLPTEPGLYVVRGAAGDEWAADLFSRDPEGFWYHLARREISDDELRLYIGSHPLERLIRHGEADQ